MKLTNIIFPAILIVSLFNSCDKNGSVFTEFSNIVVSSDDVVLNTKNKYEIYTTISGENQQVVIYPQFKNNLQNSTYPVHLHLWDAYNLKDLEFEEYYVMGPFVSHDDEFAGYAVYQHLLPRVNSLDYPIDNFWTDDIYASDYDKESYNKPLLWNWGNMIMKYKDERPAIVFDIDSNNTGKDRSLILLIGMQPEYTYICLKQSSL